MPTSPRDALADVVVFMSEPLRHRSLWVTQGLESSRLVAARVLLGSKSLPLVEQVVSIAARAATHGVLPYTQDPQNLAWLSTLLRPKMALVKVLALYLRVPAVKGNAWAIPPCELTKSNLRGDLRIQGPSAIPIPVMSIATLSPSLRSFRHN